MQKRALTWVLDENEASSPEVRGKIIDFRPHLLGTGPIKVIEEGDEKKWRAGLNTDGINLMQTVAQCTDEDIVDMAANTNFDTHAHAPRVCVFPQNLQSFYEAAGPLQEKVEEELESGMLQGPFDSPALWPCYVKVATLPAKRKTRRGRTQ